MWHTAGMRKLAGYALLVVGIFVLGGPVFGMAVLLSGEAVHVRGGLARVLIDLAIGSLSLLSSVRLLRSGQSVRQGPTPA